MWLNGNRHYRANHVNEESILSSCMDKMCAWITSTKENCADDVRRNSWKVWHQGYKQYDQAKQKWNRIEKTDAIFIYSILLRLPKIVHARDKLNRTYKHRWLDSMSYISNKRILLCALVDFRSCHVYLSRFVMNQIEMTATNRINMIINAWMCAYVPVKQ